MTEYPTLQIKPGSFEPVNSPGSTPRTETVQRNNCTQYQKEKDRPHPLLARKSPDSY